MLLRRAVLLQRAQLDAPIDQTTDDAEDGRVLDQLMPKALRQNLELVQLCHRVVDDNAIFGKKMVIFLLLLSQGMVSSGFKRQIQFFVGIVSSNAILAFVHHGGFTFIQFGEQIGLT